MRPDILLQIYEQRAHIPLSVFEDYKLLYGHFLHCSQSEYFHRSFSNFHFNDPTPAVQAAFLDMGFN